MAISEEPTIVRLAGIKDISGRQYLQAHHVAAAEYLERLIARTRLVPRLTMSYSPQRVGGKAGASAGNNVLEISDSAAQARQKLNRLAANLPSDCWDVLFDVCGMGKGLQMIETERSLPRRSAKLILRIALDQLAKQIGLGVAASGPEIGPTTAWLIERLPLIGER